MQASQSTAVQQLEMTGIQEKDPGHQQARVYVQGNFFLIQSPLNLAGKYAKLRKNAEGGEICCSEQELLDEDPKVLKVT